MNVFLFTGNLGKDAEVKYTASGMAICSFSVAVKSGYGDKAKTTWVNCGMFGKRAEGQLPQHLLKGTQVCISGEAFLDEWQGQDGQTNKMLKLNVDKLDLIGGKPQGQPMAPQPAPQQQAPQQVAPQQQQQPNTQQALSHPGHNYEQAQQGQPAAPQQPVQGQPQAGPVGNQAFDDFDDDIPFS